MIQVLEQKKVIAYSNGTVVWTNGPIKFAEETTRVRVFQQRLIVKFNRGGLSR